MSEVTSNTAFTFSKKEVLRHGLRNALEPTTQALMHQIEDKFVDLVTSELQDDGNCYQFVLSVKKMEQPPEEPKESIDEV
tara:strand:- start:31869 stop:32108 length:240 start_codon:yes stop_codon:yes gene_type:complete